MKFNKRGLYYTCYISGYSFFTSYFWGILY